MNWQPIETAPRDGTSILLFCGGQPEDNMAVGFWSTSIWVTYGNQNIKGAWVIYECRSDTIEVHPTHWMPLPPPPTVNESFTVPLDDDLDEPLGKACSLDNPECESCS